MARTVLSVCFVVFLLAVGPVYGVATASQSTVSGIEATLGDDWRAGYHLIVMNHTDMASARTAMDYVMSQGGKIALLASPHAMTGWLPEGLAAKLIGIHGIEAVAQTTLDPDRLLYRDQRTRAAVSFFNEAVSDRIQCKARFAPESPGQALINDVFQRPALDYGSYLENLQRAEAVPSPGNSDSMTGTVAVYFFFVESDGSVDPDTYTWPETDQQATISKALAGLSWWSQEAANKGINLTFTPFYHLSSSLVSRQGYEPILHSIGEDSLWIDRIMENAGFLSGSTFDRVASFNTWLRQSAGTDWAFSVFVAYNPPPAPTTFAGGPYFTYSFYGGPYVQILFIPNGWGQENFDRVLAHETGHIFWACDEYYREGYGGCTTCGPCVEGPRPSANNGNCEYCNPDSVPCMMKDCSLALCPYTRQQIGWPVVEAGLSVDPSEEMNFSGPQGGDFNPVSKTYELQNTGETAVLNWKATKGQTWTVLSASEGSLSPGSSARVTVSVGEGAKQLPPASYSDRIVFTNTTNGGGNTTRVVTLTVTESEGSKSTAGSGGGSGGGGGGCFIATAVYADANAEEVCILRRFRDNFLTTHRLGRVMVDIYYRYSPSLAARIKESPLLCAAARVVLEPLVLVIKWGQKFLGKYGRQVYINGCERRGEIQGDRRLAATAVH